MAGLAAIILIGVLVTGSELGEASDRPHPSRCAPHGKAYYR